MIYVNARFLTQKITGVQRFSIEISKKLKEKIPNIVFISPKNIIHHDLAQQLDVRIIGNTQGHLWEQVSLPVFLLTQKKPLLINLANTAPIFYKNKISTIHDIAVERFPENFSFLFKKYYQFIIPTILENSKLIFTVSEFSKSEISEHFNINKNKIDVIYNAVNSEFKKTKTIEKNNFEYILCVSSINKQKNLLRLIEAFNDLNINNLKLLIIGDVNNNFNSSQGLSFINKTENIKFLGRVSDNELISLYSNAKAFIFPSLYEGFGIPPIEAQSCGCPVISSNAGSLPEILNDSATFFNPYCVKSIRDTLRETLSNKDTLELLTKRGYDNVKRFNWDKSAEKITKTVLNK